MIASRPTDIAVNSTVTGQNVALGIHKDAMAHIMSVLTDLYSDPILAVIREYSTNALDAHIEAGVIRPIEVSLPSNLAPFLRIKDYGVGLSVDDVTEIYSQYGASTKRATNDLVGMLGLGCKSALTYASQFNLVATKNGTRVTVSVGRDEDGTGSMTIVDTVATDGPNGVEVIIPTLAGDVPLFQTTARDFFQFWNPSTVLVNGKPPEPIEKLPLTTVPDSGALSLIDGTQSYVVMGNVAYPTSVHSRLRYGTSLLLEVPIGAVDFVPSREQLHMTTKTKDVIDRATTALTPDVMANAIQREVDKAQTPYEAMKLRDLWWRKLFFGHTGLTAKTSPITYKGVVIPRGIEYVESDNITSTSVGGYGKMSRHENPVTHIETQTMEATLWVQNYTRPTFTAGQKKKLLMYIESAQINAHTIMLMPPGVKMPDTRWLPSPQTVQWTTIEQIKLPRRAATRSGNLVGSYPVYATNGGGSTLLATDIDTSKPIYYHRGQTNYTASAHARIVTNGEDCTVVFVAENRVKKFIRLFPNAKPIMARSRELFDAFIASVTDEEKIAFAVKHSGNRHVLSQMDANRVDDPALKELINYEKKDLTRIDKGVTLFDDVWPASRTILMKAGATPLAFKNYPIFDPYGFRAKQEHWYLYLNAAYAARQAGTL